MMFYIVLWSISDRGIQCQAFADIRVEVAICVKMPHITFKLIGEHSLKCVYLTKIITKNLVVVTSYSQTFLISSEKTVFF